MGGTPRRWLGAAAVAIMTAGMLAAAPPAQAATAVVQGTVTDADTGSPVAGACVTLFRTPFVADTEACTGADGRYSITDAAAGVPYRARVRAAGYVDRWHPRGVDFVSADSVVPASTPKVVDATITRHAGTLRGRVARQDGSPAPLVAVLVYPDGTTTPIRAYTRNDGEFRLDGLPAGNYRIFVSGAGYSGQWAPGKTTLEAAGMFAVTTGAETIVNERFLPQTPMPTPNTGTLTGTVLALATGTPVADACATIYRNDWAVAAVTCTDAAGTYRTTLPSSTSTYRVLVRHPGDPDVWAPSAATAAAAVTYTIAANGTTTANVAIGDAAFGATIRGRITDHTGAAPAESVTLRATVVDGGWSVATAARPDGSYEFTRLPVGDYRLSAVATRTVRPNTRIQISQWFPQKRTSAGADIVTLGNGDVVTRDETLIGPALLDLTVLDAVTRAPVTTACVYVSWETQCGDADGTYHFGQIWSESVTTAVVRDALHFEERVENIPVSSGQTSRQTVRMRPAGAIAATVVRAADGSIPRTCAVAVPVAFAAPWLGEPQNQFCNTDAQGNAIETLRSGPLPSGSYQLFVTPSAPYGAQWLGTSGGTGDRRVAAKINVRPGVFAAAPVIRLDQAGSITGALRDRFTGAPLNGAYVRPYGLTSGLSMICTNVPHFTACSGTDGKYRLDGLGPYAWPVEFVAAGHASQWSGGATDRFRAKLITVKAAGTATLDASLGPEGRIPIANRGPNPPQYWSATAFHAVTGDIVSSAVYHNPAVFGGLNTGPIYIQYDDSTEGVAPCWYYPASRWPGRRTSPTVNVTAGQTLAGISLNPGRTCLAQTPQRLSDPVPRRTLPAITPRLVQRSWTAPVPVRRMVW